jgi:hemerythrin-like metal-binding protein
MDTEKASFNQGQGKHLSVADIIGWGERYFVGHSEIDAQHGKIFDLGINVYENWRNGGGTDELGSIVEKLEALLKAHFSYEESLLTKIGYEGLNEHIAEHHSMLNNLAALKEQIKGCISLSKQKSEYSQGSMLAAEWPMLQFILGFTTGHVATSDMRYRKALAASQK